MHRRRLIVILAAVTSGATISVLLAFTNGVGPGTSGGPGGYIVSSGNCTACHPFYIGAGRVELFGAPQRYRPGTVYDLTVRVTDLEQAGAGFQISVEGGGSHLGALLLDDGDVPDCEGGCTDYASIQDTNYITHTTIGYDDSVADWADNGGSYEYHLTWEAPPEDTGPATFFVAGNAVNNANAFDGDHYYATYAIAPFATTGDGDGDMDIDLRDTALLQRCFGRTISIPDEECGYADLDGDDFVSLSDVADFVVLLAMSGPTATLPAGYVLADAVRGGLLYDKWWKVNGVSEPAQDHPLWALRPDTESNTRTGSATWRCKECHGWDYKGVDGVYGAGSHRTGIVGVFGTALSPQQLFDLLKADSPETGGHDMDGAGMTDRDLWDVVKMTLEGVIDTDEYIDGSGAFIGDEVSGSGSFFTDGFCVSCHGFDGTDINFGTEADPVYVGTVAVENPWEFMHKVRFGHPASAMPALDLLGWPIQDTADIGVYSATLPTE
jgi:thiosulfate dehydrogenase